MRGTTQREAFDRRYADGDILRSIREVEGWSNVDGEILIQVKYSNPRLAARATIEATAEVMTLPVVERWVNKKSRKAKGLREAVAAALELESAANSGVVAQTGENYRAEGHELALDTD